MLEKIKRLPFISWVYKLPIFLRLYHISLAILGAFIYGLPSRSIKVIGITGTKGKSSVLEIVNSILETAGHKTALLTSVRVKIGEKSKKNMTGNTMPGRMFIQRFLRRAVGADCEYALIEATSQGAVLYRHLFINWAIAGITNLHPEHIESHGSFEKYRTAKLSFLHYAGMQGAPIFINGEDPNAGFFEKELKENEVIVYTAEDLPEFSQNVYEILPGKFSRENIALAMAICKKIGIPEEKIIEGIENFKGVPGRVEYVQREPFSVVVDYAHTPDSLEAIYKTLKIGTREGRLICVLGSAGGGRDRWKRPMMGRVAAKYCSEIILTNEDPYDEDPAKILEEVKGGIREAGYKMENVTEILDRREAIALALRSAGAGDVIISTGKGSESWIHLSKGEKIAWDERKVFEEELGKINPYT